MTAMLKAYYEHWVNGVDLSWKRLLLRRSAGAPPVVGQPASEAARNTTELQLSAYAPGSSWHFAMAIPQPVPPPVHAILVHGSQATDSTICDFSDVDTMVLIDDRTAHSRAEHDQAVVLLRRLLGRVYSYDPLMHHGLMFFQRSGFDAYDQSFMPTETLRLAKSLAGEKQLRLSPARVNLEQMCGRLSNSLLSLRRNFQRAEYQHSDYQLKRILSGILLLPTVLLATRGEFVYKQRSFALARELFSVAQWDLIARAEEMRLSWRRPAGSVVPDLLARRFHPQAGIDWTRRFGPSLNAARLVGQKRDPLAQAAPACLDRLEALIGEQVGRADAT